MLPGGTDHATQHLAGLQEAEDAIYWARAWAQGVSWSVVLGGVGSILTGWARHDTALLCSGVTAVVVAFIPRARPLWVAAVVQTWAIRQGWAAVPAEERPLRTLDEIASQHGWTPLPDDGTTRRYLIDGDPDVIRRSPELPERERPN